MTSAAAEHLSDAKRRLIERLRRSETATAPELAAEFGLTDTAVRQHLEALEDLGLVARQPAPSTGPGRPPIHWHLTATADSWVQVIDAKGTVLHSGIVKSGQPLQLDPGRPARLVVGNVAATQVEWQGRAVDLSGGARENVARIDLP